MRGGVGKIGDFQPIRHHISEWIWGYQSIESCIRTSYLVAKSTTLNKTSTLI